MIYIPLDNLPNHSFDITLPIGGENKIFNVFTSYNEGHYWTIQFRDSYKNPITANLPLLTGQNLFQGLEYLGIGELYIFRNSEVIDEIPNVETIESDYILIWRENQ